MKNVLFNSNRSIILTAQEEECVQQLIQEFTTHFQEVKERGPTAKLWIQYFEMVTLVKQFIESERMGNWELHLKTIAKMQPYFHASGHFLYAKCCLLYLQDMHNLKDKMILEEYKTFTADGIFTIRRTNKFWSGTWSDMTIEQSLMKNMKTTGGLTRGRGVTDSVLSRWTMGMTALEHVCEELEKFCDVVFDSSEQHINCNF